MIAPRRANATFFALGARNDAPRTFIGRMHKVTEEPITADGGSVGAAVNLQSNAWGAAHAPSPPTAPANRTVKLGRRVTSARWPRQLEPLRAAGKKVAWTYVEARLVKTPFRYAFRELVRPGLADYALRHSDGRISVRHRSGDIDIFRKFYAYDYYRWPEQVSARLRQLDRDVNVLDLGANIGFFEVHAREQLSLGSVVGFEPDPANGDVWERVRVANGADWRLVRACAANRDGTVMFKTGHHNFSRIDSGAGTPVRAVDVFLKSPRPIS